MRAGRAVNGRTRLRDRCPARWQDFVLEAQRGAGIDRPAGVEMLAQRPRGRVPGRRGQRRELHPQDSVRGVR